MNSFNPNSLLSLFSNYSRKEPNQLNFGDYAQNSQSQGFTLYNNSNKAFSLCGKGQEEPREGNQEQQSCRDVSIGFNSVNQLNHQFLQNSNQLKFQQAKYFIKKPHTFQIKQNMSRKLDPLIEYSSHQSQNQSFKKVKMEEQQEVIDENDQKNQNKKKRGSLSCEKNFQNDSSVKEISKLRNQEDSSANQVKNRKEDSLQNLKGIAKTVYDYIKAAKITSYKQISQNLMKKIQQEFTQNMKLSKNQKQKNLNKSDKEKKLMEKMIKTKSFAQISQMKQMQNVPKYKHDYNHKQDAEQHHNTQAKNIRRRLYDAINVMISANVLQKRNKGLLALKLTDFKKKPKDCVKKQEQDGQTQRLKCKSYQDLEQIISIKGKVVEEKKKYKQLLLAKYLTLEKHVQKNKQRQNQRKAESKITCPVIFINAQNPCSVQLLNGSHQVRFESNSKPDVSSEIDILTLFYPIEKEEIRDKSEWLQSMLSNQKPGKKVKRETQ